MYCCLGFRVCRFRPARMTAEQLAALRALILVCWSAPNDGVRTAPNAATFVNLAMETCAGLDVPRLYSGSESRKPCSAISTTATKIRLGRQRRHDSR